MEGSPLFFLADDDEDDRMLFLEALKELNEANNCIMARSGKEALVMLQNGLFQLPDFIFLDLNMPLMNGLECLAEIKKNPFLNPIPVILYSTSSDKEYIEESMRLGAMDFFVKPSNFTGLSKYLQRLLNLYIF